MENIKLISVEKEDSYYIQGRGIVFALYEHYKNDFSINEKVIINDILYEIIGIEARQGMYPLKGISLCVKKVEEQE